MFSRTSLCVNDHSHAETGLGPLVPMQVNPNITYSYKDVCRKHIKSCSLQQFGEESCVTVMVRCPNTCGHTQFI